MTDDDRRGPLERIYDERMFPLVKELIDIAKEADMPLFLHAQLDGDLMCTTSLPGSDNDDKVCAMRDIARPPVFPMMSIAEKDGDGNVVRMTVIA